MVVSDVQEAAKKLEKLIGTGPFKIFEPEFRDVTFHGKPGTLKIRGAIGRAGPIEIHLIQSLSGENVFQEFVQRKGYGVHHLAIRTDSLESTRSEMEAKGFKVIQSGKRPGVSWLYFDTEEQMDIVFEFVKFEKE
jgi:4-hydroxyphenylpyruvate dioxygenase-like putative hemolysin